jgi:drug/metabolite transporter (DMT)-like permease
MLRLVLILVVALLFEAVGVVFLSKGLKQIGQPESMTLSSVMRLVGRGATNPNVLLGVLFEAIFFSGLLILMSKGDVSFIWPLTSLGYFLTTLAARFFLHEEVSPIRWAGVMLIVGGAALISWSEQLKQPPKRATSSMISQPNPP